jgi:hypothetical protein
MNWNMEQLGYSLWWVGGLSVLGVSLALLAEGYRDVVREWRTLKWLKHSGAFMQAITEIRNGDYEAAEGVLLTSLNLWDEAAAETLLSLTDPPKVYPFYPPLVVVTEAMAIAACTAVGIREPGEEEIEDAREMLIAGLGAWRRDVR